VIRILLRSAETGNINLVVVLTAQIEEAQKHPRTVVQFTSGGCAPDTEDTEEI
jgi:hypothetical protein